VFGFPRLIYELSTAGCRPHAARIPPENPECPPEKPPRAPEKFGPPPEKCEPPEKELGTEKLWRGAD